LAIIHNEYPEFMAFKYLYNDYLRISRDDSYSESERQEKQHEIEQGLRIIQNATAKEKAERFVQEGNVEIFWFRREESTYSSIISTYGSDKLRPLWGGCRWLFMLHTLVYYYSRMILMTLILILVKIQSKLKQH